MEAWLRVVRDEAGILVGPIRDREAGERGLDAVGVGERRVAEPPEPDVREGDKMGVLIGCLLFETGSIENKSDFEDDFELLL